jgi:uncharacterized protein (TIGR02996 family)
MPARTLPRIEDVLPFLRAIVDRPEDDLPRLIFADWLEEQGFGDTARVQRELADANLGLNDLAAELRLLHLSTLNDTGQLTMELLPAPFEKYRE